MGVTGRQGPRSDSSPVPAAAGTAAYQRSHAPWFRHTILGSLCEAHTVSCTYSWLPAVHPAVLPHLQAPLPYFARKEITGSQAPPRKGRGQKPRASVGNRRNRRRNLRRYPQVCGEGTGYHPPSCPEHLFEFITKKRVDRSSTVSVYHRSVMPSTASCSRVFITNRRCSSRSHSSVTASRMKR